MDNIVRMRETALLTVDHEIDRALPPTIDLLGAMPPDFSESESSQHGFEPLRFVIRGCEFDEFDAPDRGWRGKRGTLTDEPFSLIANRHQRPQPILRDERSRTRAEAIVEDLERERAIIADLEQFADELRHGQVALPRHAAEMPAPEQQVHRQARRIGKLDEGYLGRVDLRQAGIGDVARQRMETVEQDTDRRMIDGLDDVPDPTMVEDVTSPCERLVPDQHAARRGALAQFTKIVHDTFVIAERDRRTVRADQDAIGLEFGHHVELAFGPIECALAQFSGHSLEITERLIECADQPEVGKLPGNLAGRGGASQQVGFENFDRVIACGGDLGQLLLKRAADGNGGDGRTHDCSKRSGSGKPEDMDHYRWRRPRHALKAADENRLVKPVMRSYGRLEFGYGAQIAGLRVLHAGVGDAAVSDVDLGAIVSLDHIIRFDHGIVVGALQLPVGAAGNHAAANTGALERAADDRNSSTDAHRRSADLLRRLQQHLCREGKFDFGGGVFER